MSVLDLIPTPFGIPAWIVMVSMIFFALYIYFTWHYAVFKNIGINGPSPYPLIGTMIPMMQKGLLDHDMELRTKYGKIVGTFQGRLPFMVIYDTDILKQLLIKDFNNFANRFAPDFQEPLDKMITIIKDDHWKHVRNILTPTFSSGKLRKMNPQINKCTDTLVSNLQKMADSKETFDFRRLCGAYTMDVIASTAFGLQIDSHNDPDNPFVRMGTKAFDFKFDSPRTLMFFFFPFLMKPFAKLGVTVFPNDALEFFFKAVQKALESRETDKSQNDFIQIMMNAHLEEEKEGKQEADHEKSKDYQHTHGNWPKKGLTHEEILAQGLLFFLAGYETTANTLSLLGYNLALHQDIQEKLYQEIMQVTNNGQEYVNHDLVQKMPYLEMCLNETMRKYPPGPRTDRVASNDITINGVFIPKGMNIAVPIYALQNDPEFWPEPEKFNPDRFLPEEKEKRDPMLFLPFGLGPRHCVGMRLALMEMKMSMVHVVQKFKFVQCAETEVPLVLDKLTVKALNGVKIKVESRK